MFNKQIRKLPGKEDLASIAAAFDTDDLIPTTKALTTDNDLVQAAKSNSMVVVKEGEADDSCSYQSTDFQTAYDSKSNDQKPSAHSSRRGSFDATSGDVSIDIESTQETEVTYPSSAEV